MNPAEYSKKDTTSVIYIIRKNRNNREVACLNFERMKKFRVKDLFC